MDSLDHTHDQMQGKTASLDILSTSVGLKIHPGKSKILKTSPDQKQNQGEQVFEGVDSFCYLGSIIDRNGGTEADDKSRIGKAHAAFLALRKVWKIIEDEIETFQLKCKISLTVWMWNMECFKIMYQESASIYQQEFEKDTKDWMDVQNHKWWSLEESGT